MIITLPWPDSALLPNRNTRFDRGAHFSRREAARNYKMQAYLLSRQYQTGRDIDRISIDFYPPDNRHRDIDGMLSSIKPGIDGIFEALEKNDASIKTITLTKHAADGNPRVEISIPEE